MESGSYLRFSAASDWNRPPTGPSAAFLRFSADRVALDPEGPGGPAASTPDTHAERRPPGGGGGAEPAGQASSAGRAWEPSRSPRHNARGPGEAANATDVCRLTYTRQARRSVPTGAALTARRVTRLPTIDRTVPGGHRSRGCRVAAEGSGPRSEQSGCGSPPQLCAAPARGASCASASTRKASRAVRCACPLNKHVRVLPPQVLKLMGV